MNVVKIVFFMGIFAVVSIFAGIFNISSGDKAKDYTQYDATICNVSSHKELRKTGRRTVYDYDVVWEEDGEEKSVTLTGQVDYKEEGSTTIWVNDKNGDFRLDSPDSIKKSGVQFIIVGVILLAVTGVATMFLFKKKN